MTRRKLSLRTALRASCPLAVALVGASAFLVSEWKSQTALELLRTGLRLGGRARDVATRVQGIELPATGEEVERAATRVDELLDDTLSLARELRGLRDGNIPTGDLSTDALKLAGELDVYQKYIKKLENSFGSLERAREMALDGIRILMYNLVERGAESDGGEEAAIPEPRARADERERLAEATTLLRATVESADGVPEMPARLAAFDEEGKVCGSLEVFGRALDAVKHDQAAAQAQLRAVKERAAQVASTADRFTQKLIEETTTTRTTTILIALLTLLGMGIVTALLFRRRTGKARSASTTGAPTRTRENEMTR
jgi:hypothetical protein